MSDPADSIDPRVFQVVANSAYGEVEIEPDVTLERLGFDSLDAVELALKLQDKFGFGTFWIDDDFTPKTTVGQVDAAVKRALAHREPTNGR